MPVKGYYSAIICMNYLYSTELIGYVDLLDLNKTWPKSFSNITTPKCVRLLQKSNYFFCDIPLSNSSQKIFYCSTLKGISQATNKYQKKSHLLLAHHLLIDTVQSVWMSMVTQRWKFSLADTVIFTFKGMRLPIKTKAEQYIVIFRFYSLLVLQ